MEGLDEEDEVGDAGLNECGGGVAAPKAVKRTGRHGGHADGRYERGAAKCGLLMRFVMLRHSKLCRPKEHRGLICRLVLHVTTFASKRIATFMCWSSKAL